MRKFRLQDRRVIFIVFIFTTLVAINNTAVRYSIFSTRPFYLLLIFLMIGLLALLFLKLKKRSISYINDNGYVVLSAENELEHRHIAKRILERELRPNEIVHHINGKKIDNQIRNLCLMDREKHELFHSWLDWKKKKSGRYPSFNDQKRILVQDYGGTLLEEIFFKNVTANQIEVDATNVDHNFKNNEILDQNLSKMLFEELRKERIRIAREMRLPAYMVFYDRTLHKMVRYKPDTDALMLKMIGPSKYQKYGPYFLAVIKKFLTNNVK